MDMFYSEHLHWDNGYFKEWEDFFEQWFGDNDKDVEKPKYVWGTYTTGLSIDVDNLRKNDNLVERGTK